MERKQLTTLFLVFFFHNIFGQYYPSVYSGGVTIGNSDGYSSEYNYDFSEYIRSWNGNDRYLQFSIACEEINYFYFSIYNGTSNNYEILRSRGSAQYVANSNSITPNDMIVPKFAIDRQNDYLYYGLGNSVYQALLNGVSAVPIIQEQGGFPLSVVYDPVLGQLGVYWEDSQMIKVYDSEFKLIQSIQVSYSISDFVLYNGMVLYTSYYKGNFYLYYPSGSQLLSSANAPMDVDSKSGLLYVVEGRYISFFPLNPPFWNSTYLNSQSYYTFSDLYYVSVSYSQCEFDCSGRGDCEIINSQPSCSCYSGYLNSYCSCGPATCLNGGECAADEGCSCPSNYYGANCQTFCNASETCNGNGVCSEDGVCLCNTNYLGENCALHVTPFSGGLLTQSSDLNLTFVVNFDFTSISKSFPIVDIQYSVLPSDNSNYFYFSLRNTTSYENQLYQSNIDGSNWVLISSLTGFYYAYPPDMIQKFSIDNNGLFLYYGYGLAVYKYSLSDFSITTFVTTSEAVMSVEIDRYTNNIWALTHAGNTDPDIYFQCFTDTGDDCNTPYHIENGGYVKDFTVVNSNLLVTQELYNRVYYYPSNGNGEYQLYQLYPSSSGCACVTNDPKSNYIYLSFGSTVETIPLTANFTPDFHFSKTYPISSSGVTYLSSVLSQCEGDCSGAGDCVSSSGSYSCECYENYYGDNCINYCTDEFCNSGSCNSDGVCVCGEGYYGEQCNCSPEIDCFGNGLCGGDGSCICNSYYSGQNCTDCILPSPSAPTSFSCSGVWQSATEYQNLVLSVSENYQERRVDYYDTNKQNTHSVLQNFAIGIQYNISYNPNLCTKSYLEESSFSTFQVPYYAQLVFFNGTAGECVDNAVEIWNTHEVEYTFLQICQASVNYSVPFEISNFSTSTLSFRAASYVFNIPKSDFNLPSFCS